MNSVILASASPRRRALLSLVGIPHVVRPANIDESALAGESPVTFAERLAVEKASVVAADAPDALVIGADTIVVVDDHVLGKPVNRQDAERMLSLLSGRSHTVITAVAVVHGGKVESAVAQVTVTFRDLGPDDIRAYIATGEPMDKAGAYGIQGYGATIVSRIEGDYFAVMGMSLVTLVRLMREVGVVYDFPR
ncbi:MAG: septum formation inhibitor Maf [Gemmatimonadaceae bacterium]|nr:septum formation inhibitor Maf [Gemmatimonadaceae bacterium]